MNNRTLLTLVTLTATTVLWQFESQSARAQTTFTAGGAATTPYQWTDPLNWSNGVPNAAGETANLSFPGGNGGTPVTLDLVSTPEEVGILNIGTTDGTAGGTYTLESTKGAALTLNNSGNGAQINEISTSVGDTISAPLVIADSGGLNITDSATANDTFYITGAITGTGNLTLTDNSPGSITFQGTSLINNVGTLTSTGSSGNYVVIRAGVGSNVTSIIQDSNTSNLYFSGSSIAVASGGTTIIDNGTGYINSDGGQGFNGIGNVTLENNGSNGNGIKLGTANNVGEILVNGTGAAAQITNAITSNVSEIDVHTGSVSGFTDRGSLAINSGGTTTLENDSSTGAQVEILSAISGTGNLIIDNNGSQNKGVQIAEQTINNTGNVINSGTGTGVAEIGADGSAALGSNVGAVIEDSPTSTLDINSVATGSFTGVWEVQAGTMQFSGPNSTFTGGSKVIVGDTAAHGPTSFLNLNINGGGPWTTGTQIISGFGTIEGQSVATISGATLAPGSTGTIGNLTLTKGLNLASGTNLKFDLGTATALPATSINSALIVDGALTLPAATLNLNLVNNAGANGQGSLGAGVYDLLSYNSMTGASAGNITSLFNITAPAGFSYQVSDTGNGVGQIDLTVQSTGAVPEPSSWALLIGGLAMLIGIQKLRHRAI
jgi:fibronectin-binding autotransporter adhesin